jgi:hypothetical protein
MEVREHDVEPVDPFQQLPLAQEPPRSRPGVDEQGLLSLAE